MLTEGELPMVAFTDNHALHIQEHASVASDPTVRSDPQRIQLLNEHILAHIQMLSDPTYQSFLMLTGQPSLAGAPGMPPPAGGQSGPTPTNPTQGMTSGDIQNKAAGVQMPKQATNPQAGITANNPIPQGNFGDQ